MKANNVDLVHKTVAELFDMIKEQQKKIDELEKRIDNAMHDIGQAKDGYYGYSSDGGDIDTFAIHIEKSLNGVR